jgi:hypothetical protein
MMYLVNNESSMLQQQRGNRRTDLDQTVDQSVESERRNIVVEIGAVQNLVDEFDDPILSQKLFHDRVVLRVGVSVFHNILKKKLRQI